MIESGYCVIIRNFYAMCVPFETIYVRYIDRDIPPEYQVRLSNGEEEEFKEADLTHTKEELEKMCEKRNLEMQEDRETLAKITPKISYLEGIINGG